MCVCVTGRERERVSAETEFCDFLTSSCKTACGSVQVTKTKICPPARLSHSPHNFFEKISVLDFFCHVSSAQRNCGTVETSHHVKILWFVWLRGLTYEVKCCANAQCYTSKAAKLKKGRGKISWFTPQETVRLYNNFYGVVKPDEADLPERALPRSTWMIKHKSCGKPTQSKCQVEVWTALSTETRLCFMKPTCFAGTEFTQDKSSKLGTDGG